MASVFTAIILLVARCLLAELQGVIVLVKSSPVILDYLSLLPRSGLCFSHVCPPIKTVFPSVIQTGYIRVTENMES